jgi:homospermidine synthase
MTLKLKMNIQPKKIVIVGFGCLGQAVLPLLMQQFGDDLADRIVIITADNSGEKIAARYGIQLIICALTAENYEATLNKQLSAGDFLLNVSVQVSSQALIEFCHKNKVLYLDTCIEPWSGGYTDKQLSSEQRTNYALREQILKLKKKFTSGPTAVVAHGANPGLVSHFVKKALLQLASDQHLTLTTPITQADWANLANTLEIKAIHIAEKDTQKSHHIKRPCEFVNSWSVNGIVAEGGQPAELGWGTHEKTFPEQGAWHPNGCAAAIYLNSPSFLTRVRSWAPLAGSFIGYMITHNEAISIADFLTLKNDNQIIYRPTVNYSYLPVIEAVASINELIDRNFEMPSTEHILMHDIDSGLDELGVLLMGPRHQSYWFGSHLSIEQARELAPHNNATSMQVVAGVVAGIVWALENPDQGIVEAEAMDFERILDISSPYLGRLVAEYSDWTPLKNREQLLKEDLDHNDPWQFKNFIFK